MTFFPPVGGRPGWNGIMDIDFKKSGEEPSAEEPARPVKDGDRAQGGPFEDFKEESSQDAAPAPSREDAPEGGEGGTPARKKFVLWQRPEPQPRSKYSRSFQIALSAVSCAAAVVFLMLGYFSGVLLATGYIIAQVALMLPLSKRFYAGGFLAYLGTVLLAVVFGAAARFWDLVPFIMFFGLHPLFNSFQLRYRVNRWVSLVFKMIWFDVTLYVMYLIVFGGVIGADLFGDTSFFKFLNDYIWLFIIVLGSLFLWLYDYVMFRAQIFVNMLVKKVKK